jgi:hypothetical protein
MAAPVLHRAPLSVSDQRVLLWAPGATVVVLLNAIFRAFAYLLKECAACGW